MFGYVKPYKAELKVCEWEHYRATYCGLCHALRRKFGVFHRFALSYDITFLTLILNTFEGNTCKYEKKRCIASPFRKKCVLCRSDATDFTADVSAILSYFSICDSIADKGFFKGLPYRFTKLLFSSAYKKAKRTLPWFDEVVSDCIFELSEIERNMTASIDAPADTFARIIASLSRYFEGEKERITKELFYHIGRAIYIIDALCDMDEDVKNKTYNPIVLSGVSRTEVIQTINCSLNAAISALNLADADVSIAMNILSLGLPSIIEKEKVNERPI